ncbi:iron complex outermembrane recepter protein [Roseateles sp. YR242]|uniref:TonB-dependent receptor n=1 Tax=Roseateles sp. YR242 TaxID=1855305 RepID=UPI0008D14AC9|nr:TonB-dependent receptor [Roseateles sp. YR242]SEL81872.1 iron complex outermembrane recepter protein [Roseateles sp. YR242]
MLVSGGKARGVRREHRTVLVLVPVALAASPLAVRAEADNTLPPVIVTAERIPGPADKAPVSVAVVSQEDIEKKGLFQLNDLVGIVAGMAVPNGYSNMPQTVGLRGVGVSQPAMAQAVGIYVDDVPLLRGYATALWDLPDVVRYEVLRGPQGTLYGQNATAGAVKIVSADPDQITGSWVSAGLGNLGQREARGLFAGQLSPDLSASLAVSRRANDGFGYNATRHEDINKLDATQFRAKVKVRAGSSAHITFAVDGLLDRSDTNTTNYPLNHENAAPRVSYNASDAGAFKRKAGGASATAEWDVGAGMKLRSITAYRGYTDDPTVADWSGLEVERYEISQQVRQRTFSQELQMVWRGTDLDLVAGAMLLRDRFDFNRYVTAFPLAAPAPGYTQALTHQETRDLGLYAQGHLRLTDRLSATLGLRGYNTRQDAANAFWRTNAQFVPTQQVYDAPQLHTSEHGLLPRVGVDFNASPTTFLYASVARGEKFAGFNRAAESLISAGVAARPEKVTTYETGVKLRTAPERLTVNAAAFYNDYKDYLASLSGTTVNGVLVTDTVFLNAASARTYGVDLEAEKGLTADVSITSAVEWLRANFRSFLNPSGAAAGDFTGHTLPYAPRWSVALGLKGRRSMAGGLVTADAWLQYIDQQFIDAANTAALRAPRQTYLNFALTYAPDGSRWQASLRVRNATDRAYALARSRIPALGIDAAYYNAPRTVMANLRYDL